MNKFKSSALIRIIPQNIFLISFILILTFISFSSSLNNDYVNWDDPVHFLESAYVHHLNWPSVKGMFTEIVNTTYIPLTTLSFAVEYRFFKFNPWISHLINILLHLAVVALVFPICLKLNLSKRASFIATLLFAVHPMRVESIAWVTERKDVLYGLFYAAALLVYLSYLEKKSLLKYCLTIFLGFLSMLAKPMALSLPLILILLDWYKERKDWGRILLEKLPIFLYVGMLALLSVKENHDIFFLKNGILKAILTYVWSFSFYILKFLWPIHLTPFYPIPQPISLINPQLLISIVVLVGIILAVVKSRSNRLLIFAILFFFFSVFFLLRVNPEYLVVVDLVADRYIYLPSLGLCFLIGFYADYWLTNLKTAKSPWQHILVGALILMAAALMVKTYFQCQIWKNSLTMWGQVIKYSPDTAYAYISRGTYYEEHHDFDSALADYNKAIQLFPNYIRNYSRRAILYGKRGEYDLALKDFNYILSVRPQDWNALSNRGNISKLMKDCPSAVIDYSEALRVKPDELITLNNRGECFLEMNKFNQALEDFNQTLSLNPKFVTAYVNRGLIYAKQNNFDAALEEFNKALLLNPNFVKTLFYRAAVYQQTGQTQQAIEDLKRIEQIKKGQN